MSLGPASVLLQHKTWTDKHQKPKCGPVSCATISNGDKLVTGVTGAAVRGENCVFITADDLLCAQAATCHLGATGRRCPNARTPGHDTFTRRSHKSHRITSRSGRQSHTVSGPTAALRRGSFPQQRVAAPLGVRPTTKCHV